MLNPLAKKNGWTKKRKRLCVYLVATIVRFQAQGRDGKDVLVRGAPRPPHPHAPPPPFYFLPFSFLCVLSLDIPLSLTALLYSSPAPPSLRSPRRPPPLSILPFFFHCFSSLEPFPLSVTPIPYFPPTFSLVPLLPLNAGLLSFLSSPFSSFISYLLASPSLLLQLFPILFR